MNSLRIMLRAGNFLGTGTRRSGFKGNVEAQFGWHAGKPGQPITDESVTDKMRGEWL